MTLYMKDLPRFVTPAEAARHLSVCRRTVLRWVANGWLAHIRSGRLIRIPAEELTRLTEAARRTLVD